MNEEQEYLVRLIKQAVHRVYQEDRPLLQFSGGVRKGLEQAFGFRTGVHLIDLLSDTEYAGLDVDSEYNKNGGTSKTTITYQKRGRRPDLILHKRYLNTENKLIAQFKGDWAEKSLSGVKEIEKDFRILEDFTNPNVPEEYLYDYLIGVFVLIRNGSAEFKYFIDGREVDE